MGAGTGRTLPQGTHETRSPLPAKLEIPYPKACQVQALQEPRCPRGKHMGEGARVSPGARDPRVSTRQRPLALCLFYVFISTSIYL